MAAKEITTYNFDSPPPYEETTTIDLGGSSAPWVTTTATNSTPFPIYQRRAHRNKKLLGCCDAKTWVEIIAGLQIFFSLSTLIFDFVTVATNVEDEGTGNSKDYNTSPFSYSQFTSRSNVLVEGVLGFFQGCILLAGAYYGKPVLLLLWLVGSGIEIVIMVFVILVILFVMIFGGGGVFFFFMFLCALFFLSIPAICFWIVFIHRRQLLQQQQEEQLNQVQNQFYPMVQLQSLHPDQQETDKFQTVP